MAKKKAKTCHAGCFGWLVLAIVLKVFGVAFLVQGFMMQFTTGILYYGALHYLIGMVFVLLAWHSVKKCGCDCH
ncbi:hypothetical protein HOD38_03815 [archaeon]|jgi:hypothetical protein|nr:hypothetical protein [archaeon]MBT4397368.1 hypothetical protein [archaeon]MBT4440748.1 hypothetical protein [archaeon]